MGINCVRDTTAPLTGFEIGQTVDSQGKQHANA